MPAISEEDFESAILAPKHAKAGRVIRPSDLFRFSVFGLRTSPASSPACPDAEDFVHLQDERPAFLLGELSGCVEFMRTA
jgi:hypothetical protein